MTTRLQLLIDGDATGAKRALSEVDKGLGTTESKMGKFNTVMGKAALPAAGVLAGLSAMGKQSFDAASAFEQSAGAVESVFGSYASAVQAQADQASQNVGLAKSQYNDLSAVLGAQLGNMGVAQDQLAGQTANLIGLGSDLAATFGGETSDAVAALSSLLRGERDPIERYGVSIKAADIEARKAAMGLSGLSGEADAAATTQATLALLTEQTAAAQGAFAREAETAAGQQQRANAAWQDAQAALGETLLPVVSSAAEQFAAFSQWVQQNSTLVTVLVGAVGLLAAGVLVYNGVMAAIPAIQAVATAAQWAWNAAMSANPLGLIIIAIAAVIAGIVLLVQNWDWVKETALEVWAAISSAASAAWDAISSAAGEVFDWLTGAWDSVVATVTAGWDLISSTASGVWDAITGFVSDFIGWVTGPSGIQAVPNAIQTAFEAARKWVSDLFGRMSDTVTGFIDKIAGIPGRIRSALGRVQIPSWLRQIGGFLGFSAAAAAPTAYRHTQPLIAMSAANPFNALAAPQTLSLGGDVYEINITGAFDADDTAEKIRQVINRNARNRGVVHQGGVVIP